MLIETVRRTIGLRIVVAASATLLSAASALAAGQAFPVQRAEPEFRQLLPFLRGWGEVYRGDQERFRRWALPFGPLDLEVRNASVEEAEALRSFYLGVAGELFGIDATALEKSFHCGVGCTRFRKSDVTDKLAEIEKLVATFQECEGVRLVAQWGTGTDFRVNDLFQIQDQIRVTGPSPIMGFVPSGSWMPLGDANDFIRTLGCDPAVVGSLVRDMHAQNLAALVRDGAHVRVVHIGVGDNEAGVIFSSQPAPYKVGQKLRDGRRVILVELLKAGIYYYETT